MRKIIFLVVMFTMLCTPRTAKAETCIDFGEMRCTAYCPCEECSEGYGRKCALAGHYCRSEHTIAVDPDVISLGSKVKVGDSVYTAEDVGGQVSGDHIDIFFDTHEEVEEFGVKYKQVEVIID